MASYGYNPIQGLQPNGNALLLDETPCKSGNIMHREGSGILTLRGSNNRCNPARYLIKYYANIAVQTGSPVGAISTALALSGEILESSRAIVTPAAVEEYFAVARELEIVVPSNCCVTITVKNASVAATPGATVPVIDMQNLHVEAYRTA